MLDSFYKLNCFSVDIFSPYYFHYVVVSLLYGYFRGLCAFAWFHHRHKCLLIFVMGCLHVSSTFRLSIKGSHWKTFFKMGRRIKSLRRPWPNEHCEVAKLKSNSPMLNAKHLIFLRIHRLCTSNSWTLKIATVPCKALAWYTVCCFIWKAYVFLDL